MDALDTVFWVKSQLWKSQSMITIIKRLYLKHSLFFLLFMFSKFLQLAAVGGRILCWLDFWSHPAWLFLTCPTLHRNPVAEEAIPSVGKHSGCFNHNSLFSFLIVSYLIHCTVQTFCHVRGMSCRQHSFTPHCCVFLECRFNFPISEAYLSVEVCQEKTHSTKPKPMGFTGLTGMGSMPGLEELNEEKKGQNGVGVK